MLCNLFSKTIRRNILCAALLLLSSCMLHTKPSVDENYRGTRPLSSNDKLKLALGLNGEFTTSCAKTIYKHAYTKEPLFHFLSGALSQSEYERDFKVSLLRTPPSNEREIIIVANERDLQNLTMLFMEKSTKEIFAPMFDPYTYDPVFPPPYQSGDPNPAATFAKAHSHFLGAPLRCGNE